MDALRLLAIVWALVVAAMAIGQYMDGSDGLLSVLIPVIGFAAAAALGHVRHDKRFRFLSSNVLFVSGFAALILPLFILSTGIISNGLGIAIYVIFVVVSLLFADYEDIPFIENESFSRRSLLGVVVGIALGILATHVYRNFSGLIIGYLASSDVFMEAIGRYIILTLLSMFVVAIPEEMMFRVFLMKVGRAAITTIPAAILSGAMWFALHAVTRVPDYMALAIIGVVGVVISFMYVLVDFGAAVLTHAMYNVAVIMVSEFGDIGAMVAVAVSLASLVIYLRKEVKVRL